MLAVILYDIWVIHNHSAEVLLICLLSYVECVNVVVLSVVEHSMFVASLHMKLPFHLSFDHYIHLDNLNQL